MDKWPAAALDYDLARSFASLAPDAKRSVPSCPVDPLPMAATKMQSEAATARELTKKYAPEA